MTNRPKSIADALAEVQHKVNEERRMRLAKMAETYLDEAGKADTVKAFFSSITKKKPAPGTPGVGPQPEFNTPKPVAGTGAQPGYNSPVGSGQPASGAKPAPSSMAPEGKPGAAQPDYNTPKPVAGTGPQPGAPAPTPSTSVPSAGSRTAAPTPSSTAVSAAADDAKKVTNIAKGVGAAATVGAVGAGVMATKGSGSPSADAAPAPAADAAPAPANAPTPPPRPTGRALADIGGTPRASATRSAPQAKSDAGPAAPADPHAKSKSMFNALSGDNDTSANFFAADAQRQRELGGKAANDWSDEESGGKSKKKSVKESTLISAFMRLQTSSNPNIFEAAKKMKGMCPTCGKSSCQCAGDVKEEKDKKADKDYDGDGKIESGKDEVWGSRFKAAKKAEKMKAYRADRDKHGEMEEEVEQIDERDMDNKAKKDAAVAGVGAKNRDEKHLGSRGMKTSVADKIRGREVTSGKDRMEEEVSFSESELAHFSAILEADAPAVAKVDANKNYKVNAKGNEVGTGPTAGDLSDETIAEGRRKPGVELKKAGRPVGSKSGSKHANSGNKGDDEVEAPSAVPHVLDQIRHAHERGSTDERGNYSITHPADRTKTAKVSRKEAHGFYTSYHDTEKPEGKTQEYEKFLDKHFGGDTRTTAPTHHAFKTDLSSIESSNLKGGAGKVSLGGSSRVGGSK